MDDKSSLIRFDWAAKRLLRDKANFVVLEGFLSVVLRQEVKIEEILESEGNQDSADSKFNRVDMMARNSAKELVIIEIQLSRQIHIIERMLFGVGKALTDNIRKGDAYHKVKKVYSIGILYFNIGEGADYIYDGQTVLKGRNTGEAFRLSASEMRALNIRQQEDIFPEYHLIKVNEFNKDAITPLEEWIDYLKTGRVRRDTEVPGLKEAREKLNELKMGDRERAAYNAYLMNLMNEKECLETAREEGRAEGRAEGEIAGKLETARNLKSLGIAPDTISAATGLSLDEIASL